MVCAARYSGIKTYRHTDVKTVVGCTKIPGKKSQYCTEHGKEMGPVVLAEQLSANTKDRLRKKQASNYPQDNVFFVRSLLNHNPKSDQYLVQWAHFPLEDATWEHSTSIPKFISKIGLFDDLHG